MAHNLGPGTPLGTFGDQLDLCDRWIELHAGSRREVKTTNAYKARIERGMALHGKTRSDPFNLMLVPGPASASGVA